MNNVNFNESIILLIFILMIFFFKNLHLWQYMHSTILVLKHTWIRLNCHIHKHTHYNTLNNTLKGTVHTLLMWSSWKVLRTVNDNNHALFACLVEWTPQENWVPLWVAGQLNTTAGWEQQGQASTWTTARTRTSQYLNSPCLWMHLTGQ